MDTFRDLIDSDEWDLVLPLTVRNVLITEDLLSGDYQPSVLVSAADSCERVLFWTRPMMRGEDVKRLQKALGFPEEKIDGIFGKDTDRAVREFQRTHGLTES